MRKKVLLHTYRSQATVPELVTVNQSRYDKLVAEHTVDGVAPYEAIFTLPVSFMDQGTGDYMSPSAVQDIVNQINDPNDHCVPAYNGHSKSEDLGYSSVNCAAYWVSAWYDAVNEIAYMRCVVSKHEPRIASDLRTDVLDRVSVSGFITSAEDYNPLDPWDNRYLVLGFEILSIDFVPSKLAGMNAALLVSQTFKGGSEMKLTAEQVAEKAKESGLTADQIAVAMGVELTQQTATPKPSKLVQQSKTLFGKELTTEDEVATEVESMKARLQAVDAKDRSALITQTVAEKITDKHLQSIVIGMVTAEANTVGELTVQTLTPLVDKVLENESIKGLIQQSFAQPNVSGSAAAGSAGTVIEGLNITYR